MGLFGWMNAFDLHTNVFTGRDTHDTETHYAVEDPKEYDLK